MRLPFCIIGPNAEPKLEMLDTQHLQSPEGGYLCSVTPAGIPSTCVMPCDFKKSRQEQYTDYFCALVTAETFLHYDKLAGLENAGNLNGITKPLLFALLRKQTEVLQAMIAQKLVEEFNMPMEAVTQLLVTTWCNAHDKCCPDPQCKTEMKERIFGKGKTN